MRVLVTGAEGFVGRHLLRELAAHGHQPLALDVHPPASPSAAQAFAADIRDRRRLESILRSQALDACAHLAGLTFVPDGRSAPEDMLAVNVIGTAALLEACRTSAGQARILVVSTAQVYGTRPRPHPVREEEPFNPESLYAISKAAADQLALLYAREYGMPVLTVRPHNHVGPGQSPHFVVPSLARQIREQAGRQEVLIRAGNLESYRDFTDVRDVVRAYRLLLERGRPGRAYNLASGRLWRIGDVLDRLCALAGVRARIEQEPALYRPADRSPLLDTTCLREDTGWQPDIPFDTTLRDVLNA